MPSARKFKLKLNASKPRNPLVRAASTRKAGRHGPSSKAARQREKTALRQQLSQAHEE